MKIQFPLKKKSKIEAVEPVQLIEQPIVDTLVPNVVGMKVIDAVNLLNKRKVSYEFAGFKEVVPKNVMEGTVKSQILISNSRKAKVLRLYISMDLNK